MNGVKNSNDTVECEGKNSSKRKLNLEDKTRHIAQMVEDDLQEDCTGINIRRRRSQIVDDDSEEDCTIIGVQQNSNDTIASKGKLSSRWKLKLKNKRRGRAEILEEDYTGINKRRRRAHIDDDDSEEDFTVSNCQKNSNDLVESKGKLSSRRKVNLKKRRRGRFEIVEEDSKEDCAGKYKKKVKIAGTKSKRRVHLPKDIIIDEDLAKKKYAVEEAIKSATRLRKKLYGKKVISSFDDNSTTVDTVKAAKKASKRSNQKKRRAATKTISTTQVLILLIKSSSLLINRKFFVLIFFFKLLHQLDRISDVTNNIHEAEITSVDHIEGDQQSVDKQEIRDEKRFSTGIGGKKLA